MKTAVLPALIVLVGCAGCGLQDPYNRPEPRTVSTKPAGARASRTGNRASQPVTPASPRQGGAEQTLAEFAQAYGTIAPHGTQRRLGVLESLATEQLAREIAREAHGSPAGVPDGGFLSSEIVNLDIAPSQGPDREAVVALEQRLAFADGRSEQAITDLFVAALVLTPAGWRVASFTPQQ